MLALTRILVATTTSKRTLANNRRSQPGQTAKEELGGTQFTPTDDATRKKHYDPSSCRSHQHGRRWKLCRFPPTDPPVPPEGPRWSTMKLPHYNNSCISLKYTWYPSLIPGQQKRQQSNLPSPLKEKPSRSSQTSNLRRGLTGQPRKVK